MIKPKQGKVDLKFVEYLTRTGQLPTRIVKFLTRTGQLFTRQPIFLTRTGQSLTRVLIFLTSERIFPTSAQFLQQEDNMHGRTQFPPAEMFFSLSENR